MHLVFYPPPPNVFLFVGPGTRSPGISKPAHAGCFIGGDLTDKTTYWLSNRIHAVDLRSLRLFISLLSSRSRSLSLTQI